MPTTPDSPLIVFTDLDGCLLDETTYEWDAAAAALAALRRAEIPLVLASSKTRAEMVSLARELELADDDGCRYPLIVENGGGVLLPAAWRPPPTVEAARDDDGWMVTLGTPVAVLDEALEAISAACGVTTVGFSAMTDDEVAALTGLSPERATRARRRELDEPFVVHEGGQRLTPETPRYAAVLACLERAADARGLRVTRGGRFLHLTGDADKGRAAAFVLETWTAGGGSGSGNPASQEHLRTVRSIGLGDAPNDLPMLERVDVPVIVPRSDHRPHPQLLAGLPHAAVAPHPGPAGWNAAVLDQLRRHHAAR